MVTMGMKHDKTTTKTMEWWGISILLGAFKGVPTNPGTTQCMPCSVAPLVWAMDKMIKKLSGDYRAFGGI